MRREREVSIASASSAGDGDVRNVNSHTICGCFLYFIDSSCLMLLFYILSLLCLEEHVAIKPLDRLSRESVHCSIGEIQWHLSPSPIVYNCTECKYTSSSYSFTCLYLGIQRISSALSVHSLILLRVLKTQCLLYLKCSIVRNLLSSTMTTLP